MADFEIVVLNHAYMHTTIPLYCTRLGYEQQRTHSSSFPLWPDLRCLPSEVSLFMSDKASTRSAASRHHDRSRHHHHHHHHHHHRRRSSASVDDSRADDAIPLSAR